MDSTITIHLQSTFNAILTGKFYNFTKRSLWRYMAASVLFAFAKPDLFGTFFTTFLYFFCGVIGVAFIAMYLSSKYMANKNLFDADVEFTYEQITIRHRNKDLIETKDWLWIKALKSSKDGFLLEVNQWPPFFIHFSKKALTEEQIEFFENREVL